MQGPPPGFANPLVHVNGRPGAAPPSYSSSESLSASLDQQRPQWDQQSQPHSWLSQPPSQPPTSTHLSSFQANAFAMPSLSTGLHSLWSSQGTAPSQGNAFSEQAAEHSLFSGSPHLLGFPQSQLRQQSRFQFAQER